MTDAISYQMLCRGQLEYFKHNSEFDMTFISGGSAKDFESLIERKVGKVLNIKFIRRPSLLKDFISLTTLTFYLTFYRFDLVVYSTPKALLLGSLATSITCQSNTVAIVRGRAYENYKGRKRKFYEFLDKISLSVSDRVVFISNSLMDAYVNEGIADLKKSFILGSGSSNGVDASIFTPNGSSNIYMESDEVISKDNRFLVLIAGRICLDKGLQDLVKIVEIVDSNSVRFCLVGPVEGKEAEELLEKVISNHSNVEHVPYSENIEDFFKTADLHLFLTHREGFGNVAIEAASCGVPTFAYDVIGVKDSVKIGVSGEKFVFQDFEAVASAIDEASKDPNFNERYPNARAWVIENFEKEKVWKNYLDFYKLVLKKNS
ncbi:glycosyltransferase [Psychrobacter sp. Arc29]|uniref:glycosyltransferase n=1 Tax=Psychrobacter sp. Arc29 TaxID=3046690 RepID=UPI00352FEEE5